MKDACYVVVFGGGYSDTKRYVVAKDVMEAMKKVADYCDGRPFKIDDFKSISFVGWTI